MERGSFKTTLGYDKEDRGPDGPPHVRQHDPPYRHGQKVTMAGRTQEELAMDQNVYPS
jgi:hypothetical protein